MVNGRCDGTGEREDTPTMNDQQQDQRPPRRMYAGQLRTPEQIERRRAWKRQHNDNGRRIFFGADYQHMVATVELAQEINAACAAKAAELWVSPTRACARNVGPRMRSWRKS